MAHEAYEERFRKRLLRDIRANGIRAEIELAKGDSDCACNPETLTWCINHVSTKEQGDETTNE